MSHLRDVQEVWFYAIIAIIGLIVILGGLYALLRDYQLRGRRISNYDLQRENITPAFYIPHGQRDFK